MKHHKAAGVLYIFLPDEISKISAGFLPKQKEWRSQEMILFIQLS